MPLLLCEADFDECAQGGAVIDKMLLVKDRHGAGLYDCHLDNHPRRDFRPSFLANSPLKRDQL